MVDEDTKQFIKSSLKVIGMFAISGVSVLLGEAVLRDNGVVDKLTKKSVEYDQPFNVTVFGKTIRYKCRECAFFKHSEGRCKIVEDYIDQNAGCIRWIGVKLS